MTDHCHWLAEAAAKHERLPDLHHAFCDHLLAEGLPIWRASLGVEILHPETSGAQLRWIAAQARPGGELPEQTAGRLLAADRETPIIVFDLSQRDALVRAVKGEHVGTLVHS